MDGQNDVVKPSCCGSNWGDSAALRVDDHIIGLHTNFAKHGAQESGFIFAVAISVEEDFGRGMRLPASDPKLDGDIPNILLRELGKRTHLGKSCRSGWRDLRGLFLDFLRRLPPPIGQATFPFPHGLPVLEPVGPPTAVAKKGNNHESSYTFPRRHFAFRLDRFDIAHDPLPLAASTCWLHFGMIQPDRLVFPPSGELEGI